MSFSLVADENFNEAVVAALESAIGKIARVRDLGLGGIDDPSLLAWCANHDAILVSHDVNTMSGFAADRIRSGLPVPGLWLIPQSMPIGLAIEQLLLLVVCTEPDEHRDRTTFFPLR